MGFLSCRFGIFDNFSFFVKKLLLNLIFLITRECSPKKRKKIFLIKMQDAQKILDIARDRKKTLKKRKKNKNVKKPNKAFFFLPLPFLY